MRCRNDSVSKMPSIQRLALTQIPVIILMKIQIKKEGRNRSEASKQFLFDAICMQMPVAVQLQTMAASCFDFAMFGKIPGRKKSTTSRLLSEPRSQGKSRSGCKGRGLKKH